MKILVINPGSTSTKIAVFEDKELIFELKLDHTKDPEFQKEFSKPGNVMDQYNYRFKCVAQALKENDIIQLDAIVGRGGMLPPVTSGTYLINEKMIDDLKNRPQANHASNLGAPIAFELAKKFNITQSFIVDPVTTDEIELKHKVTGIPGIQRYAGWHALNQKAVSRKYAESVGKKYEDLNLIVAHLGGGFSFGAHKKGRTINVTNALAGEGPMSPERSGQVPAQGLIDLCFSGKYTKEEVMNKVLGGGGLFAHLGTKDVQELEKKYDTLNKQDKDVVDEMIAGVSRSVCSMIPDFEGEEIDQIILTGGVAYWKLLTDKIKQDVFATKIGVTVYPGEKELEALRDAAIRVLTDEENAKEY
ncbi:MAG: butyrate kinase [Candidatus Shapirobacteria bacterium]|nr:butyrate kinase [Candidatus Shapirobacteria bacterium]MDD3003277.1 butyrate kinase [Candidatus Shapirobacteria bacterium]MDD4382566.1 butyrate kinase [Candidatus Shapirobacteria bacterium]